MRVRRTPTAGRLERAVRRVRRVRPAGGVRAVRRVRVGRLAGAVPRVSAVWQARGVVAGLMERLASASERATAVVPLQEAAVRTRVATVPVLLPRRFIGVDVSVLENVLTKRN